MPIRFRILPALFLAFTLMASGSCVLPESASQPGSGDALLALYRDDHLRPLVVDYYAHLTGNRPVTAAILETCDQLEISPSLGFALAWNESRFDPRAVRYNETTMDRGLFQLNSRTFARLDRKTLFDPKANALHGLTYYKKALDRLGSEEKALGYYNAGIGLLSDRALPRSTQAYVKKILADRDRMDKDAIAWIYFSHDTRLALK
jgi:soluble lytic murein transglycosylase-like protein